MLHVTLEIKKSKKDKLFAFFIQKEQKILVSVSSKITTTKKENLQISWCEDRQKKRFYLIHWPMGRSMEQSCSRESNELDVILAKLCDSGFDLGVL